MLNHRAATSHRTIATSAALAMCATIALTSPAIAGDAARVEPARFNGTWTLMTKGARGKINEKIEPVVKEHFSIVTRSFARSALRKHTKPARTITIKATGAQLLVSQNGEHAKTTGREGAKVKVKRKGKTSTLEQFIRQNTLYQRWIGTRGARKTRYTLSADGKKMTVHVTITAKDFTGGAPKDLRYTLTYKKI